MSHCFPFFDPAGIDLRREFEQIMAQQGHWAVLRRRQRPFTTGRNPTTHEGDSLGTLGDGSPYVDEFIRVRKMTIVSTGEVPNSPTPGRASSPIQVFWCKHHIRPNRGDWLIELAQDPASLYRRFDIQPLTPYEIIRKYDIQDVDDMREAGGRIEFWKLVVEDADLGDEG